MTIIGGLGALRVRPSDPPALSGRLLETLVHFLLAKRSPVLVITRSVVATLWPANGA